jgi:NodT family efflux transporter outer membrane factor (OMF) lipoprotein
MVTNFKLFCRPAFKSLVLTAVFLSGCMVGPDFSRPEAKLTSEWQAEKPGEFTAAVNMVRQANINPVKWWESFNDPTLNRLLDIAAKQNLSLQVAALRVFETRAQLGVAKGSLLPNFDLGGRSEVTRDGGSSRDGISIENTKVNNVSIDASWEIDFWGKFRRGIESSQATYLAAVTAYYSADVSLASNVANTYINIRNSESLMQVALTNLALQAESLRIAKARFEAGATSLLDLSQAQAQYEQTKSEVPGLIASLRQAQNAMSVLLGQPPPYYVLEFGQALTKPSPPASLDVGIPQDLLRRRPDVLQAEYLAASRSALIGVSEAALYPSFSLSGFFGFQSGSIDTSSGTFTWSGSNSSIGGNFFFPLFYRGTLVQQVRVQDAIFQQSILNYQNVVLNAQREVQDALSIIATTSSANADLLRAVTAAKQAASLALDRYISGQNDYNTVIVAQQALQRVQNASVQTQTNNLLGYVAAFKSLGGGWSGEMTLPMLPAEMVATMTQRTDWGDALSNPASPTSPTSNTSPSGPSMVSTNEAKP